MKLSCILILSCCLVVSAKTRSQTVTLDMKDVPVQQVFKELMRQTGVSILYNEALFRNAAPVTIKVKDAPVKDVLDLCLKDQPVTYSIESNTIVVKGKSMTVLGTVPPGEVHGRVTNAQGQPLAGATVTNKRTQRGTVTNAKGEFILHGIRPDDMVVLTFVGYSKLEVKPGSQTDLTLVMEFASDELDKVVVQAYGTTTQRLATGNIATVTAKEIERQPVTNPLQALQGLVPGLDVLQTSGYASAPFKIEIRGRSQIANVPADPLFIIDGVPLTVLEVGGNSSYFGGSTGFAQGTFQGPAVGQSPLYSINPSDIENMTVLKDADATAIYGSRGANGVIIINTKKGSNSGKANVEINAYQGESVVTRHYDMFNTQQYLVMRHEAFANDQLTPRPGNAYDFLIWDTTRYTDWQKELWGSVGKTTDAQLSLSAGERQNSFRVGVGFRHVTDITSASGSDSRGSLQMNLAHRSFDQRFSLSISNIFTVSSSDMISYSGLALLPPNAPPAFDADGKLNYRGWDPIASRFPFAQLKQPYTATTYFLNSGVNLKYEILRGLTLSTNLGYSMAILDQNAQVPIASTDPLNNQKGSSQFGYNNNSNWIVEPQLDFNRKVGRGKIGIMVGGSIQDVTTKGNDVSGDGYSNDALLGSVSNAPVKNASDFYARYKYAAVFSRINFNWMDKYILNLSARRDGSSRFGPGKQFGNFGSAGVAWILSREGWFENLLGVFSVAKLRASYGTTGNDQIGDYQYLTRWGQTGVVPYLGVSSYIPTQHANPDYQWEVNKKLEVAVDLSFLKDRINFELAWYRHTCNNQLISLPLPQSTGFPFVTANSVASVQNTGVEIYLNGRIVETKNVSWEARLNFSANRNKLLAYPNLEQSPYAYSIFVGKSLNIYNVLHFTGVDRQTGQYTYEDKNKDGSVSSDTGPNSDLYQIDVSPKYFGSFVNSIRYKNISVNVAFYYRHAVGVNEFLSAKSAGGIYNVPIQVLDHWQKPGDVALFARYTTRPNTSDNNFRSSDAVLTDASYIRLSNLSLSYHFNESVMKKLGLKGIEFYIKGQNLFVITKYKGVDPEVQGFGSMPVSKIIVLGLKVNL